MYSYLIQVFLEVLRERLKGPEEQLQLRSLSQCICQCSLSPPHERAGRKEGRYREVGSMWVRVEVFPTCFAKGGKKGGFQIPYACLLQRESVRCGKLRFTCALRDHLSVIYNFKELSQVLGSRQGICNTAATPYNRIQSDKNYLPALRTRRYI